jgi:septum formation protein
MIGRSVSAVKIEAYDRTAAVPTLILASTSNTRRALLERLGLPFSVCAPVADESPLPGELPSALALRLSLAKARSVRASDALVIGSDQVAALDQTPLGKPGGHGAARAQLLACQGRSVNFFTAVTVLHPASGRHWQGLDRTCVQFARLDSDQIEHYLRREQPYDCAGSFKAEGLGIALFERIESEDPTGVLGLPLIWLSKTLRAAGLDPLLCPGPPIGPPLEESR